MSNVKLWQGHFGHLHKGDMVLLLLNLKAPKTHLCQVFILGKTKQPSFPKDGFVRVDHKLQHVNNDVCGSIRTLLLGIYFYFMTFIDY